MKLISLNTQGGTVFDPFMQFVRVEAPTTDVFCFQEMYGGGSGQRKSGVRLDLFEILCTELTDFTGTFACAFREEEVLAGLAIFIKKSIPVVEAGSHSLWGELGKRLLTDGEEDWPSLLQYAVLQTSAGLRCLAHLHGLARPGSKTDTPARIEQSERIVSFVSGKQAPTVVCGDFNLMPNTQSIARIEKMPMRNLIKEFNIVRTRPLAHLASYTPEARQYFADYAFVSPEVTIQSFSVPEVEISDHLPLVLEIA